MFEYMYVLISDVEEENLDHGVVDFTVQPTSLSSNSGYFSLGTQIFFYYYFGLKVKKKFWKTNYCNVMK